MAWPGPTHGVCDSTRRAGWCADPGEPDPAASGAAGDGGAGAGVAAAAAPDPDVAAAPEARAPAAPPEVTTAATAPSARTSAKTGRPMAVHATAVVAAASGVDGSIPQAPLPRPTVIPARVQPLVDATAELAALFSDAGHQLFLVGGSVRDAIVGLDPDRAFDFDLATDARPEQTEALLRTWADAVWTVGKRFGTIGAKKDDRQVEITTFRAEAYSPDSRHPEVSFGDTIEGDLARRDFTVNAMALALPGLQLVDPYGGLADLA